MRDRPEPSRPEPDDVPGARREREREEYDRWFDGLLDGDAARAQRERVARDPEARARFEADRAIEAALRRAFGAPERERTLAPAGRAAAARPIWGRRAAAAALLVALGGTAWMIAERSRAGGEPQHVVRTGPPREALKVRAAACSLGDVFLDALAGDFQPLLDCRIQDPWDAELYQQLAAAPCTRDESLVVLGEWIDPRVSAANMVLLRHGENPVMLVLPNCEQEAELCVPKDSGLYVHRGWRAGRPIYEISPVPGSEILQCVDAENVVTQQQF